MTTATNQSASNVDAVYEIRLTGEKFQSFGYLAAIKAAQKCGGEVHEIATGTRRWMPAQSQVNPKKMSAYLERKAAYDAQEKHKAKQAATKSKAA